ncbi:peptidoglycan-binding protein [Kitasatospora sp. NPDC059646]|uniref:peptidoglycan-binding domain-containing protein n=1 Tax=Kitasatospora sp. NPDC059646 TaxID=3346893 RepID=UPI0036ADB396
MLKRQLSRMVVVGGVALAAVCGSLATAEASTSAPYIGYGYSTSGSGVWCVQHELNHAIGAGLSEDGQFGPATYNALVSFQARRGLQADGVVGPQTGSALIGAGDPYYGGYCYSYIRTSS